MTIESISIFLQRIQFGRLAVGVILINLAILAFLVLPGRNVITSLQQQYGDLRQLVAGDQRQVRDLKNRVDRLQRAQSDLKKIYTEVLLPQKEGVLSIRLELEDLARSLQVKRGDFSYNYDNSVADPKLQEFRLAVSVDGNYRNIRKFINSIERSRHFLILNRVDLSSDKKPDSLSLDFQLSTYLVKEENEP
jgi:Tfp pilus assembly protein PilO